jgi:hypothetical protein
VSFYSANQGNHEQLYSAHFCQSWCDRAYALAFQAQVNTRS